MPDDLSVNFPMLGLGDPAWTRTLVLHGWTEPAILSGTFGPPIVTSVTHAYFPPGGDLPRLVIGQAENFLDKIGNDTTLSLLLRHKDRPRVEPPSTSDDVPVTIDGQDLVALRFRYQDTRIQRATFVWNQNRRVDIASWEFPLDPHFFRDLVRVR